MTSKRAQPNRWRWTERGFADDIALLFEQRRLAWELYLADIAEFRRNSGLGMAAPFLSVLVHVILLGSVMAMIFGEPMRDFLPYFAVSFSLWQGISLFVSSSANANEKTHIYLPFPNISGQIVYLVSCYEYFIAMLLKLAAAFIVFAGIRPELFLTANYPAFLLGLIAGMLAMFFWGLPISYLFDRFRLLRGFLPQILFAVYLMTPVLWRADRLGDNRWVADLNPVFHLVEAARAPLLDGTWPITSLLVVVLLIISGMGFSALAYSSNRAQVVYRWVA